ncbi:hypothetical protein C4565_00335 [Candidatus Parcubacteria bacterium]|nr:MAG: hypothetical protein C4565_00335 [Candidatus Parcubacteria bacterium]
MASSAKKSKHESKMKRKRAEKAAKKSKYAALAGTSKKNKRRKIHGERSIYKHFHNMANCGNIGCGRCYPQLKNKKKVA